MAKERLIHTSQWVGGKVVLRYGWEGGRKGGIVEVKKEGGDKDTSPVH